MITMLHRWGGRTSAPLIALCRAQIGEARFCGSVCLSVPRTVTAHGPTPATRTSVLAKRFIKPHELRDTPTNHRFLRHRRLADIYMGPDAPKGKEKNWIPTVAGKGWFPYFRLYSPKKAFMDRSWVLPDEVLYSSHLRI